MQAAVQQKWKCCEKSDLDEEISKQTVRKLMYDTEKTKSGQGFNAASKQYS